MQHTNQKDYSKTLEQQYKKPTEDQYHYHISKISHEIRNPVTLINTYLQLLAQEHPEITDCEYWKHIVTNMDFLKSNVRNHFFKTYPEICTKVSDLPPAKYNPGTVVKNSLIASGSIVNGTVENSILFKKVFVGNNCVIKNSIILNDVYLGDNTYIENCIVESNSTIRANTRHIGEGKVKVVVEKNERFEF